MGASKGVLLTPKIYRVISKRAKEIIGLLTLAIFLSLVENRIPSSSVSSILIVDYLLLCIVYVDIQLYSICKGAILLNLWRLCINCA